MIPLYVQQIWLWLVGCAQCPRLPLQVFLSNPKLNLSDTRMPLYDQDPVVRSELLWSRHDAPPQELLKCRLVNMWAPCVVKKMLRWDWWEEKWAVWTLFCFGHGMGLWIIWPSVTKLKSRTMWCQLSRSMGWPLANVISMSCPESHHWIPAKMGLKEDSSCGNAILRFHVQFSECTRGSFWGLTV